MRIFRRADADEHYISTLSHCFQISRVFVPKTWIVQALMAEHVLGCMQSNLASTGINACVCLVLCMCKCEQVMCPQLGYRIMRDAGQALA